MRSALAWSIYVLHVLILTYGALGWVLPMPGPLVHLVFLLGVRYHWHVTGGCIITEWEKRLRGIPSEEERHFTRNLLRGLGMKHIDDEGAYKVLTAGIGALAAMDTVFIAEAAFGALN